ncbi:hypothetical protein BpHYR1_017452 [Brachionus plicatilis]|uniref:Uncharacterized protein n=1 Tax=Brachionus plicatilis TaxID=10195 RepID=A0A3M7PM50_BRAPC|nr:hypothetical protein BpHYR1_017452 [Brachionus plicatilis]
MEEAFASFASAPSIMNAVCIIDTNGARGLREEIFPPGKSLFLSHLVVPPPFFFFFPYERNGYYLNESFYPFFTSALNQQLNEDFAVSASDLTSLNNLICALTTYDFSSISKDGILSSKEFSHDMQEIIEFHQCPYIIPFSFLYQFKPYFSQHRMPIA